ncbi:MAG: tRNA pseudouridine(55) synthase TruB [Nitrospirae bacterium]|nr:tRNA pseudouridine(55) synthase TruB [Nitrospirota bacterium]
MNIIINLDKPKGITSQQAVTNVKRLLGVRKAGHTGTLDPMATGVLLVCLNEATKVSRFLLDKDKTYQARLKLGERTDTLDADGKVIEIKDVPTFTPEHIISVVNQFIGKIMQKPPMYSAIKLNGQPLYKLARKGMEVERAERPVEIYDINILLVELPYVEIAVSCSKGTYIRTLCDDIGLMLGTGAHITALKRTGIGFFTSDASVTFDMLQQGITDDSPCVSTIDHALTDLSEVILDESDCRKAKNGIPLSRDIVGGIRDNAYVRLKDSLGSLFGIGMTKNEKIIIERNLNL